MVDVRQILKARQDVGIQDSATNILRCPLSEIDYIARQIMTKAVARALAQLESERRKVQNESTVTDAERVNVRASLEDAQQARKMLLSELIITCEALQRCLADLNLVRGCFSGLAAQVSIGRERRTRPSKMSDSSCASWRPSKRLQTDKTG